MSRQTSAILLSVLVHVTAVVSVTAMGLSISPASRPVTIDLGLLDTGCLFAGNGQTEKGGGRCLKRAEVTPERMSRAEKAVQEYLSPHAETPDRVPDQAPETGTGEIAEPAGQAAQSPGGTGSADRAGSPDGGGPGSGPAGGGVRTAYLAEHFAYIRDLIRKNAAYPSMARKLGLEGRVVICFVVLTDGGVKDVRVTQSSGSSLLDSSALDAVRRASPFPRPPVEAEIVIPVAYSLR